MQEVIAQVWVVTFAPTISTTIKVNTNRYSMTPDIETGNQLIDSEHIQIFDAVNALLDACSNGRGRDKIAETAEFLATYVGMHFSDEENLQKKCKYPNMEGHLAFHKRYRKDVSDFVDKVKKNGATVQTLGELNALVSKLISHIRQEDKRLAAYIRENS